jgi:hypothetical protein
MSNGSSETLPNRTSGWYCFSGLAAMSASTKLSMYMHTKNSFKALRLKLTDPCCWIDVLPSNPFEMQRDYAEQYSYAFAGGALCPGAAQVRLGCCWCLRQQHIGAWGLKQHNCAQEIRSATRCLGGVWQQGLHGVTHSDTAYKTHHGHPPCSAGRHPSGGCLRHVLRLSRWKACHCGARSRSCFFF